MGALAKGDAGVHIRSARPRAMTASEVRNMNVSKAVKRLFVMPVGHIENDLMWNLAGITAASRSEPNRPARWVRVPCLAYLIEHATKGWILYDTGFLASDLDKLPEPVREQFPGGPQRRRGASGSASSRSGSSPPTSLRSSCLTCIGTTAAGCRCSAACRPG